MSSSSPLRFLAPGALLAVLVAVFLVVQSGTSDDTATPTAGTTTERTTTTKGRRTYTVRPGDNLSEIAQRYGLTVEGLQELNPDVDPQAIRTGQRLRLRD
jgi:LysM repeat protein